MKRTWLFIFFIILFVPVLVLGQGRKRPMTIGSDAPDFSLPDVTGKIVNLADFKGKTNVMLVLYRGWLEDHF